MTNPVLNAIRRNTNQGRKLNILTIPTHEGYQSNLSQTGHNFYMLSGPGLKTWDHHTRALPSNHYIHGESYETLVGTISYDLVLCQNKLDTYPLLRNIADTLQLPLIILDHTEPPSGLSKKDLEKTQKFKADAFVSITPHNLASWGLEKVGVVIPHGIDLNIFKGYNGDLPRAVNISNHFKERDHWLGYEIFREILRRGDIMADVIGENTPPEGLVECYLGSISDPKVMAGVAGTRRFYLNTTQLSPLPLSLLEAMAIGLPVVTTAKQHIPEVVRNGVEGFISNDVDELVAGALKLLAHRELAHDMGCAATERIASKFSMTNFVRNWNQLFDKVYYGS